MPRNTKGGNKAKKGANKNYVEKKVEEPTEGQYIGIVTKYLGNSRCDLTFIKHVFNKETNRTERIQMNVRGLVRGSVKKRVRLNNGDLVLLSIRDFQNNVVDILVKYSDNEIYKLKKKNIIENEILKMRNSLDVKVSEQKNLSKVLDDSESNETEERDYFEYDDNVDDNTKPKERKKDITSYKDIFNEISDEEEDDYEDFSHNQKTDAFGNFIENI